MINCNICEKDLSNATGREKMVFALIPVDVNSYSYTVAEWFKDPSNPEGEVRQGLSYFLHRSCLDRVIEISKKPHDEYVESVVKQSDLNTFSVYNDDGEIVGYQTHIDDFEFNRIVDECNV